MRGDVVQLVSEGLVDLSSRWELPDNFRRIPFVSDPNIRRATAFVLNYGDLALGWRAARSYAAAHEPLPVHLTGDDHWVWRAYLACCRCCGEDADVSVALALRDPAMVHTRNTLEAYLLCEDADMRDLPSATGLPEGAIRAYEKLFFNVRDRFEDYLFLANAVYPRGRLEELYDDYLMDTPFGDVLRRTGYNSGKDYVSFMAGVRSPLLKDMQASDMAFKLERVIMANGFIMAGAGLLNQRDAAGIHNARSLIAAAKAGGMEHEDRSGFERVGVGSALRGELLSTNKVSTRPTGSIIDAEMVTA